VKFTGFLISYDTKIYSVSTNNTNLINKIKNYLNETKYDNYNRIDEIIDKTVKFPCGLRASPLISSRATIYDYQIVFSPPECAITMLT